MKRNKPDNQMGVAIYGLMRSGTTLVSDMLTVRGRSIILNEPDFFVPWDERIVKRTYTVLREFGLPISEEKPDYKKYRTFARYFDAELLPALQGLELWGIKQVQFLYWRELFGVLPPERLVLCVRDMRDVVLSTFELIARMGLVFGSRQILRDEAWVMARLCHDVHELLGLMSREHLLVRYEELVRDTGLQAELAEYVSLDEIGTERLNLAGEHPGRRDWELAKHGNTVSTQSIGRYRDEPDGPARAIADRMWKILFDYSERLGYEAPGANSRLAGHSLVADRDTDTNPVSPALLDWGTGRPVEYEVAFARRYARIAAVKEISPGTVVLDLGCVVPALKLMLPPGCRYIGSDVAERFDGCLVADYNAGELPPRGDANLVTVLGLLEYLDDIQGFLHNLRAWGVPVLVSYHALEDTQNIDRGSHGWKNALTRQDLASLVTGAGFDCTPNWAFDGKQSLLRLEPSAS